MTGRKALSQGPAAQFSGAGPNGYLGGYPVLLKSGNHGS